MTPACSTTCPELASLAADYETLTVDFMAVCADLRVLTDHLLELNTALQNPAVEALLREREHERRVLAELANR